MQGNRLRRHGGFTLVEVMTGVMLLGIVLVSVLAVAIQAFDFLGNIRRRARASQILQQRMEDVRLLNWSQLQALPGTFQDPSDTNGVFAGSITQTPYDSYRGTTTVMEVALTVTWTNRTGQVQTNSLTTLVTNGGLNKFIF